MAALVKDTQQADPYKRRGVGLAHHRGSPYINSEEAPVNGRWLKSREASIEQYLLAEQEGLAWDQDPLQVRLPRESHEVSGICPEVM